MDQIIEALKYFWMRVENALHCIFRDDGRRHHGDYERKDIDIKDI